MAVCQHSQYWVIMVFPPLKAVGILRAFSPCENYMLHNICSVNKNKSNIGSALRIKGPFRQMYLITLSCCDWQTHLQKTIIICISNKEYNYFINWGFNAFFQTTLLSYALLVFDELLTISWRILKYSSACHYQLILVYQKVVQI